MLIKAELIYWPEQSILIETSDIYKIYLKNPENYTIRVIQASNLRVNIRDNVSEVIPNIIKAKIINLRNSTLIILKKIARRF